MDRYNYACAYYAWFGRERTEITFKKAARHSKNAQIDDRRRNGRVKPHIEHKAVAPLFTMVSQLAHDLPSTALKIKLD